MTKRLFIIALMLFPSLENTKAQTDKSKNRTASYYHSRFNNRKTASGQRYNENKPSAASNEYPLGTKLLVTNLRTGDTITVVVNDRMAKWVKGRIDLSKYSFKKISPLAQGLVKVKLTEVL